MRQVDVMSTLSASDHPLTTTEILTALGQEVTPSNLSQLRTILTRLHHQGYVERAGSIIGRRQSINTQWSVVA